MFRDIKEDINESRNIPCPDCLLHSPSFAALDVVLYLEPKSWCLRKLSAVNKCLYKKEELEPCMEIILIVSALLCPILNTSSLSPALMARSTLLELHGGL